MVVADIKQEAIDIALKAGADEGVIWDPMDSKISAAKTTHGRKVMINAALDFVAHENTVNAALYCLQKMGVLITVGLAGGELRQPIPRFITLGIVCQGSNTGTLAEMHELVAQTSEHKMRYPSLEYYTIEDINHVLNKLKAGQIKGRAILKFQSNWTSNI